MTAPRLLFHVQHMLGIGHRVRAERIAAACVDAGFDVTVMEGGIAGQIGDEDDKPGLTRIQLPAARAADAGFSAVVDAATGQPIDDAWRQRRAEASLAVLDQVQPDILMVEGYPFARRAFAFELDPLITEARARGIRTAVSLRDILVTRPDAAKTARIAEAARALYDLVLVHGDPGFAQLADSFPAAAVIADRIRYTGIVSPSPVTGGTDDADGTDGKGEVIISAGGGAVGGALCRTALAARALSSLNHATWRILVGPNLPEADRDALAAAPDGVIVEPVRADFLTLLGNAAVSISQAGYNTVADLALSGCPSVLVPFAGPTGGETEQPTRAHLLARAGRAVCLPEAELSPATLATAIDQAVQLSRAGGLPYRIGGGPVTAQCLLTLLETTRP